jgi:hypothetical protein
MGPSRCVQSSKARTLEALRTNFRPHFPIPQIWALNPPTLLTTFKLPPSQFPTALTIDPLERSFHVGTQTGDIHHVRLYRRRREIGRREEDEAVYGNQAVADASVAVGGGGVGGEEILVVDGEAREKGKGSISLG